MTIDTPNLESSTVRTRTETVVRLLAGMIVARRNCQPSNAGWFGRHTALINQLAKDVLPSGSGIDCGTVVDLDDSRENRLVLVCEYHHMNDGGYYDGWTTYRIIVTPDLISGFNVDVRGRDRNDVKKYLAETYRHVLGLPCEQAYDTATETTTFRLDYGTGR